MDSKEVDKELGLSYDELCDYLLEKYGAAKHDYFVNESCRTTNKKVSRTKEGLFCHHMDEDKAIMLCNPKWALRNPFEYQKADRLVYCNALEHLILHIKIMEEPQKPGANELELQGIGGAVNFLIPELNHCYSGYEYKRDYEKNIYGLISENFDDYIKILKYLIKVAENNPIYLSPTRIDRITRDVNDEVVERVYNALVS